MDNISMKPEKAVKPTDRTQLTLRMDKQTYDAALRLRAELSAATAQPVSLNEAICTAVRMVDEGEAVV